MFRVLLLILVVSSSFVLAQTDVKPEARKIDEFGKATNGNVKMRMQSFYLELNNDPAGQGYIINYGTDREIAVRERQIKNAVSFFKVDTTRLTLVRGGNIGKLTTQFWLIPAGAERPKP